MSADLLARILEELAKYAGSSPYVTADELAADLGASPGAVRENLRVLYARGDVRRNEAAGRALLALGLPSPRYVIVKSGRPGEGEPVTHVVVMECTIQNRKLWAWCTLDGPGPGFASKTYTLADGVTPIEVEGTDLPTLDRHLFTVAVFEESQVLVDVSAPRRT